MIARKRVIISIPEQASDDLDDLEKRNPFAWAMAISTLKTAATGHKPKAAKRGRLEGHESLSFPTGQKDEEHCGRVIFKRREGAVEIIAVSDDHDDAYRKARARVKPRP